MMTKMNRHYLNGRAFSARTIVRRGLAALAIAVGVVLLDVPGAMAQGSNAPNGTASALIHERYPAGSIRSMEAADAALADVARARSEIEARFAAEEYACHRNFFSTSCIDKAKDRRRQESAPLRKIELEAEQYKRQERVIERDNAAVQRREKAEAARLERVRPQSENDGGEFSGAVDPKPTRDESPPVPSDRTAEHEARLKRIQEKDAANAERRVQNAMKYEKKAQAAQERQKKLAQKKAEKDAARQAGQSETRAVSQ